MTAVSRPWPGQVFDVGIIGGGVVGCAVARRATLQGARVVLLEAGHDILSGASKANSAIMHTGFDAPENSVELALMRKGRDEYLSIRGELGLPLLETGAIVAAWTEDEAARLQTIARQGRRNGVEDIALLSPRDVADREPNLARALAGLWIAGEHIIDPWSAPLAYLRQAVHNGAVFLHDARLQRAGFDGTSWALQTSAGSVTVGSVVNCAGLHGDAVDALLTGKARFSIRPRKGQFVVFDKAAARLLSTIILPVPSEHTKGVVLCPTVFGNLLVGPTAEEQDDRDRATVDSVTLSRLVAHAETILPPLAGMPVTAAYAGLRPATEEKGYRLFTDHEKRLVTVGGVRSTGLTAALGIAQYVWSELSIGADHRPIDEPRLDRVPNLAEHVRRPWQADDHGEIVCHCEMVTRREITDCLKGEIPARDLGGLKRRTRATMGRCQGYHCAARIAAIAGQCLDPPLAIDEVAA